MFDEKLKLEQQISKTEEVGCSWLEPFSKFVNSAILAQKIARKGSVDSELRFFVQNIGSNFFLKDKQIMVKWEKPLRILRTYTYSKSRVSPRELRARAGARATTPKMGGESLSVAELGFEPRISSFKGRRPTTRRLGNYIFNLFLGHFLPKSVFNCFSRKITISFERQLSKYISFKGLRGFVASTNPLVAVNSMLNVSSPANI